jgi:NADPH2:quinone reductase
MRAWQVQSHGEPVDVLRPVELAPPEPGPGQVAIKVTAAGIGLPDVFMCRGIYPLTPPLPFTPGQEGVGIVTAAGEGVEVPLGARVMVVTAFTEGHGSFAEHSLANATSTFPVPDGLTDSEAAGFWIPHFTGWIGLVERGHLTAGEWLVVLGAAGGSGIAAVQLGRALGARVIAVVSDDERAAFCQELGAEATVNRKDGPLAPALREITDGRGVDVIYDPVGGSVAVDAAKALARDGRLLAVGFASGSWPRIEPHDLVVANTSFVGVFAGGYARAELDRMHERLSALIGDGRLRSAVTATVPYDQLPHAVQRLADNAVVGKLVVDVAVDTPGGVSPSRACEGA